MRDSEKHGRALVGILRRHAEANGITVKEAFDEAYRGFDRLAKWGPMPSEYDPSTDESHPSKGWAEQ